MPTTTAQKLKIKEGNTILTVDAPTNYKKSLGPTPKEVTMIESGKAFDQLHWFVKDKSSMEKGLKKVLYLVKGDILCWIFYPKGTSGMQTDLNRDSLYQELLRYNLQFLTLISFDDTWSALACGRKQKKTVQKKPNQKSGLC